MRNVSEAPLDTGRFLCRQDKDLVTDPSRRQDPAIILNLQYILDKRSVQAVSRGGWSRFASLRASSRAAGRGDSVHSVVQVRHSAPHAPPPLRDESKGGLPRETISTEHSGLDWRAFPDGA